MKVRDIAYSRSGDKGDVSNVCVFPLDDEDWPLLLEQLTSDVVRAKVDAMVTGDVTRYEVPSVHGLNFVMTGALAGGVSRSLRIDPHGKSMQSLVLDIDLPDRGPG
jgi:hypothetical protein